MRRNPIPFVPGVHRISCITASQWSRIARKVPIQGDVSRYSRFKSRFHDDNHARCGTKTVIDSGEERLRVLYLHFDCR